jgi:hypothetical protein
MNVNDYVIPGLNASVKRTLDENGISVSLTHAELRMIGRMPAELQDAAALEQLRDKLARKTLRSLNPNEPGVFPAYPREKGPNDTWVERTDLPPIGARLSGPGFGHRGTIVNRKKHAALKALYSNPVEVAKIEAVLAKTAE